MNIYDISQELTRCEAYEGDTAPNVLQVKTINKDGYNLSDLTMCVHNGTHIDAPSHFCADGNTVDELPLAYFIGRAQVEYFDGAIDGKKIKGIKLAAKRLLIKGGGYLTESGAKALADKGVILVGTESQSVGDCGKPEAVHLILLKEKIVPLEGIRLGSVKCGLYYLLAQPINIAGCDGSPVRAVLVDKFDD